MKEKRFLEKVRKYAICKTLTLSFSLLIAAVGVIIWALFSLVAGFCRLNTHVPVFLFGVYIIAMAVAIAATSHYDKVREQLINEFGIKSLEEFFEYFTSETKRRFVYYETKDIFMYGLWRLNDNNPSLKQLYEINTTALNKENIKHIHKEDIMVSSIFKCLTFKKDDRIYRNQHIFLDQEKFLKIIDAYAIIYKEEKNNKRKYIKNCGKIEKKYQKDKEYAKENYKKITKKPKVSQCIYKFLNESWGVLFFKIVLLIIAVIALTVYTNATTEIWECYIDSINFIVTVIFDAIAIILLFMDIIQHYCRLRDRK